MLSRSSFEVHPLPRIVFAVGASRRLAELLEPLGASSVLIVTDPGVVAAGLVAPMASALSEAGLAVEVFAGVEANPTDRNVTAGAAILRRLGLPVVMALGGGSAMDAAKAIALLGPNDGGLSDILFGTQPQRPGATTVAVPTTAGTGSETNMFGVITDTGSGRKVYIGHPSVRPVITVLDPELTLGLPRYPTATCGMDVLTHAIEALTAVGATPYSDSVALGAIAMVAEWLPRAVADGSDIEARSQMLLASSMAAIAFNVAGLGACHGTGHPLSARLHAAHGQTLATMLPHVMAFNADVCAAKYARVASALGASGEGDDSARAAIDAVRRLRAEVGVDRSIRALGGSPEMIEQLAADAMADMITFTNPKPVSLEQVVLLYEQAMD